LLLLLLLLLLSLLHCCLHWLQLCFMKLGCPLLR
jgi:hypothetical protein